MMKTVVIFKSKTGFARKYAEWIAAALGADLFEASKIAPERLAAYDTVIYGGGLYAVGINGVKLITGNLDQLDGKKVVVFATGASSASDKAISDVVAKNFTPEQQRRIRFFYLRGGFNYHQLRFFDKLLMTLLKWNIMGKKELTPDEQGMLAAFDEPADFTDKRNIDELIAYIKQPSPDEATGR